MSAEDPQVPNVEKLTKSEVLLLRMAQDHAEWWTAWGIRFGGLAIVATNPFGVWDDGSRPEVGWEPLKAALICALCLSLVAIEGC